MLGNPPELLDPKFYQPEAQRDPLLKEEYDGYLLGWLMQHTKREVFQLGQEAGMICSPFYTIDEVSTDPQLQFREFLRRSSTL